MNRGWIFLLESKQIHCTLRESRARGRCLSGEMRHKYRHWMKQRGRPPFLSAHFNFITTQLLFLCATDNKSRGPICRLKRPRFSFKGWTSISIPYIHNIHTAYIEAAFQLEYLWISFAETGERTWKCILKSLLWTQNQLKAVSMVMQIH